MFKKGDRVIAVDCPGLNGKTATVEYTFGSDAPTLLRVLWDHSNNTGEYYAYRFKLIPAEPDTPFSRSLRAYIQKELPCIK